jgi:alcohol dehydrogenase
MDRVLARELEIYGSHGIAASDYADLLSFVETRALDLGTLVGRSISLEGAGDALRRMSTRSDPGITVITLGA